MTGRTITSPRDGARDRAYGAGRMWARAASMSAVACLGAMALAGTAHAVEGRLSIGSGVAATTELGDVWLVSPLLELGAPITQTLGVQVMWGFTIATGSSPNDGLDGTHVEPGNPLFAFPIRVADGLVFAPGFTLPIADLPDDTDASFAISRAAVNGGRGLRGTVDQWLWFADEVSLVMPLSWAKWVDPFLIEVDAKLAYVVPVTKTDPDDDFVLQANGRMAWRMVPGLFLGVELALVFIPTNSGDNAQTSIAPELRYVIEGRGHLEASLLMNLDTPFGPTFQAGRVWGIHLGGGMSF